jgi:putative phosphonate metabolism protein
MRYAIYFTPPADDPLTRAAARWIGRDAFGGELVEQPGLEDFTAIDFHALTDDPRRYGFHATLKAPFALADGHGEEELIAAFSDFAAEISAFELPEIVLGRLGPFFALVPHDWNAELQLLCDESVIRLDNFRAPLSDADIARRNPQSLTASQRQNLTNWGYPYVFEDFRFHMTLTGPVPEARQPAMQKALNRYFAGFAGMPLSISHLALFVEPERGAPFVVKHIARLAEPKIRKTA